MAMKLFLNFCIHSFNNCIKIVMNKSLHWDSIEDKEDFCLVIFVLYRCAIVFFC